MAETKRIWIHWVWLLLIGKLLPDIGLCALNIAEEISHKLQKFQFCIIQISTRVGVCSVINTKHQPAYFVKNRLKQANNNIYFWLLENTGRIRFYDTAFTASEGHFITLLLLLRIERPIKYTIVNHHHIRKE